MANHVERVHHRAFAISIGAVSEDGTKLLKSTKPAQLQCGLYSEVTFVTVDKMGEVASTKKIKGVIEGCDQLQKKLTVKTHHGIVMVDVAKITKIAQTEKVDVKPGCPISDVPENAAVEEEKEPTEGDSENTDTEPTTPTE